MIKSEDVTSCNSIIAASSRVVLLCHSNPDGDAIGSLLGMGLLIEKQFPGKIVELYCKDPAPSTFHFLQATKRIQHDPQLSEGTCVIFVDSAEPKLSGLHESHAHLYSDTVQSINIDHHPTNTNYARVNIVDPDAASACEIVVEIARKLQWQLDSDIATALLTGVYTDTGGLLHSNTSISVYRTVAELLRAGAKRQEMVESVFRTAKVSTLKLWGRVLEKISLTDEGGAVSAVTKGDFAATGADQSELTGAIDYLNAVPGMRFSMILSERNDGKVKGSLRTLRDDVDVAKMAGKFDGGGHKKAAGFALQGKLQPEIRWKVVKED